MGWLVGVITSSLKGLITRVEFLNHLESFVHILEVGRMDGLADRGINQ